MTAAEADLVYHGHKRRPGGAGLVTVDTPDGQTLGLLPHVARHSPTGFGWGYQGSGPADLARSLLIAVLAEQAICRTCAGRGQVVYDPEPDREVPRDPSHDPELVMACADCDDRGRYRSDLPYQHFKRACVATFGDEWTISRGEILAWLAKNHPEVLAR
jgi:Family of unknown function (DUF6166)